MAHPNQQAFFREMKEKFPSFFSNVRVLDIGSLDINGNLKQLFNEPNYIGVDVGEGPNVDVVSKGHEYDSDELFDVVVSAECFEHDMYYDKTIKNMIRLLKPGGLMIFSCASTCRPEHGTLRSRPQDAPLLNQIDEEWKNYYKNLDESDIREVVNIEETFHKFHFREGFNGWRGNDLYFWGIKK